MFEKSYLFLVGSCACLFSFAGKVTFGFGQRVIDPTFGINPVWDFFGGW
jgi:hypothetical protein